MINPMVARLVRDPFDREGWLFELKWDGFRAIAQTDGQGAAESDLGHVRAFPLSSDDTMRLRSSVSGSGV